MKRQISSLLITILLFASLGAFAAVVKLFPDIASDMPLVPRGSGTLTDSFLALIGKNDPKAIATSTGIVQNAVQLGGFSGSQYVRVDSACSDPLKPVWVSVDAAGKPICGSKSSPGLVYLGTISEVGPGVSIYQASGSIIAATVGAKLYNGDTIDTGTNGKTTVLFTDRSLIRLKENTTVTLDVGKYAGTSIANVILGRGDLWGRVLAENGQYDVGTIDIVAAVRGTSFSLQKGNVSAPRPEFTGGIWNFHFASGNPATLIVVDTVNPNTAVEVRCTEPNSRSYPLQAPERGNNILYGCSGQSEKKTNTQLYTESAWLRENTRADITYMNGLKSKSEKVTNEQALSEPTDAEKNPLCLKYNGVENGVWFTPEKRCVFAYADYTTGRDEMILANVSVTPLGWRYADGVWKLREPLTSYALNPGEKGYRVYLKDSQNTLSTSFDMSWKRTSGSANMAMNPNGAMLIGSVSGVASSASGCMEIIGRKTGANNESYCTTETNWVKFPVPVLSEGISITSKGQYIEYDPKEFPGTLSGKRVSFKLNNTINDNKSRYILDLGTYGFLMGVSGYYKLVYSSTLEISVNEFTLENQPSVFILGNRKMEGPLNLLQVLGGAIQSVAIY